MGAGGLDRQGSFASRGSDGRHGSDVKSVDNKEVIFDNKGNPIFLSKIGDNLSKKALKNKLHVEIPVKVENQVKVLEREAGHIAVYK